MCVCVCAHIHAFVGCCHMQDNLKIQICAYKIYVCQTTGLRASVNLKVMLIAT
jgi:hypothetical protein